MSTQERSFKTTKVDPREFDLPETLFVRDIDNQVFQGIVLECLSQIDGIVLAEGNFIDSLLGRSPFEGVRGIYPEQDQQNHTISLKIELSVCYGVSIPEKAEEIQTKVAEQVTLLTGLHVSCVHVVFKNIVPTSSTKKIVNALQSGGPIQLESDIEDEYNDEF